MTRWRLGALLFLAGVVASGATGIAARAQKPPAKPSPEQPNAQRDPKIEEWKPETLPADALAYGAALAENAGPQLKKWCEAYARHEMPKQRIDPRATMGVVDRQFPKASDEARDAAIFLVFYLAYQEEDKNQRQLAAQIRRMDNEAYDITLQMKVMKETEQNRMVSTRKMPSQQELIRNDEQSQQMDQQLRSMSEERRVKMKQLETLRKRVNGYLKVMAVTYPRMNGIAASIVRTMP